MLSKTIVLALKLVVSAVHCQELKNITMTHSSGDGSFSSPFSSLSAQYVIYTISCPSCRSIQFDANSFDIKSGTDTLVFTENGPNGQVMLGSYTGKAGPVELRSSTNIVTATFKSIAGNQFSSFSIQTTNFLSKTDTITVPASGKAQLVVYQSDYARNALISYTITGPVGRKLQFDTDQFDLEAGWDTLVFTETIPGTAEVLLGSFTGRNGPQRLQSNTNVVVAKFKTDRAGGQKTGYVIAVSSFTDAVKQVNVVEGEKVTFTSPGFPSTYGNFLNLVYTITGPTGHGIQIDSESFDLEASFDSLVFSETVPGHGEVVIGAFHGKTGPSALRSSTNKVTVTFKTDATSVKTGFSLTATSYIPEPTETTTPGSGPGNDPGLVTVTCLKGKIELSEADFENTEASEIIVTVDNTRPCRNALYDIHTWILAKQAGAPARSSVEPVSVSCNRDGVQVSESDPDDSVADQLIFTSTAHLKCRTVFVEFLGYIAGALSS